MSEKLIQSGELKYLTDLPKRDPETGLVIDTGEYDEALEARRREHASGMAYYAEAGKHYDPTGKYLCGGEAGDGKDGCNQYRPEAHKCVSVKGRIDGDCGSCEWWENYDINRPNIHLGDEKYSKGNANYAEREPGGTGFGCIRCEYAAVAKKTDKDGRNLFCGIWGCRVQELACCGRNHKHGDIIFEDSTRLHPDAFYRK